MSNKILLGKNKEIACVFLTKEAEFLITANEEVEANLASSEDRRLEFLLGRTTIRTAAKELSINIDQTDILKGSNGLPILPMEFSASVSHTHFEDQSVAVAAITLSNQHQAVGIDIEHIEREISERALSFLYDSENKSKIEEIKPPIILHCLKEASFKYLTLLAQRKNISTQISYKKIQINMSTVHGDFIGKFEEDTFIIRIVKMHEDYIIAVACEQL